MRPSVQIPSLAVFLLGLFTLTPGLPALEDLSNGFDDLSLGMEFSALDEALQKHAGFLYRGLPEVSLSPAGQEKIIETRGGRFIKRGIFQFSENKLFSIILDLNEAELDYYTLFTSFSTRYGDPLSLDPRQAIWENSSVRMILEKPLTLKYLSVPVLMAKERAGTVEKSIREENREDFIKKL